MKEKIKINGGSVVVVTNKSGVSLRIFDSEHDIEVFLTDDQAMSLAGEILDTSQEPYLQTSKIPYAKLSSKIIRIMGHADQHEATVNINLPDKEIPLHVIENIQNACGELMEEMGFELEAEDHPVYGSFFQSLLFKLKQPSTQRELEDIYDKGKLALESKYLNEPTAAATEKYADAASKLIASIASLQNAVIRLGALLIIKTTTDGVAQVAIQTISPLLASQLDAQPDLLNSPQTILEFLGTDTEKRISKLKRLNEKIKIVIEDNATQKTLP